MKHYNLEHQIAKHGLTPGVPPKKHPEDSLKKDPAQAGFWRREVWRGESVQAFRLQTYIRAGRRSVWAPASPSIRSGLVLGSSENEAQCGSPPGTSTRSARASSGWPPGPSASGRTCSASRRSRPRTTASPSALRGAGLPGRGLRAEDLQRRRHPLAPAPMTKVVRNLPDDEPDAPAAADRGHRRQGPDRQRLRPQRPVAGEREVRLQAGLAGAPARLSRRDGEAGRLAGPPGRLQHRPRGAGRPLPRPLARGTSTSIPRSTRRSPASPPGASTTCCASTTRRAASTPGGTTGSSPSRRTTV